MKREKSRRLKSRNHDAIVRATLYATVNRGNQNFSRTLKSATSSISLSGGNILILNTSELYDFLSACNRATEQNCSSRNDCL
jgi:hypothetical protein